MADTPLLPPEPPRLALAAIDELARLHARHALSLAWDLDPGTPRVHVAHDPAGTVTELLRLAHLGAVVEAATPHARLVDVAMDARRRWALDHRDRF